MGVLVMKLLNYDIRYLIMQRSKKTEVNYPSTFTLCQYQILCRIIIQKKIKKEFFYYLLFELYGLADWKEMNYQQMYEIIFLLSHWK